MYPSLRVSPNILKLAVRSPLPYPTRGEEGIWGEGERGKNFLYVILFTIGKSLDMSYIDQYDDDYLNG